MEDPKILDVDPLPLAPLVLDTLQTLGCYPHHPVRVAGRMRQNMKFDALCDFVEEELQDIKRRMQARQAILAEHRIMQDMSSLAMALRRGRWCVDVRKGEKPCRLGQRKGLVGIDLQELQTSRSQRFTSTTPNRRFVRRARPVEGQREPIQSTRRGRHTEWAKPPHPRNAGGRSDRAKQGPGFSTYIGGAADGETTGVAVVWSRLDTQDTDSYSVDSNSARLSLNC